MIELKNWRLDRDEQGTLWSFIDVRGQKVNTLGAEVLTELEAILDHIIESGAYNALVIASDKKSGFIAGADVKQFIGLQESHDEEQAYNLVRRGQLIFDKLAGLSIPTIVAISGFCLGGGFELALACDYRIVDDGPKTKLGLPEVLLGIHPGWGGTVRLPALIGAPAALPLILSGRMIDGKKAKRLGIANEAVPNRQLLTAAAFYASGKGRARKKSFIAKISNVGIIRKYIAKDAHKALAKKINQSHYPAPFAALDTWRKNGIGGSAIEAEAKSMTEMMMTSASKELVRVFFLREKFKSAVINKFDVQHVHVIGAGTMGGDIAAWCALRGIKVTLQDRAPKYVSPAISRAHKLFKAKLKKPHLIQNAMDNLIPDVEGNGVARADVIIEAIYENLDAKRNLFRDIEQRAKHTAIFATNTSSIQLDDINQVLNSPERLVGIHFFNPVAKMQLVEIVKGEKTSQHILDNASAFVQQIDRLPLVVKSCPGFLVNRILMPYLMECVHLLESGIAPEVIDHVAKEFGMPMGPVELADYVGLDICLSVGNYLAEHYGREVPAILGKMVTDGYLGRKTDKGFYEYQKGKPVIKYVNAKQLTDHTLIDRLLLPMLNEVVACLREGIVSDADALDAGMIFGTGFAPFRGGPAQYIKQRGAKDLLAQMEFFKGQCGERFTPDQGWSKFGEPEVIVDQTEGEAIL